MGYLCSFTRITWQNNFELFPSPKQFSFVIKRNAGIYMYFVSMARKSFKTLPRGRGRRQSYTATKDHIPRKRVLILRAVWYCGPNSFCTILIFFFC
ncbi:hypothetical protein NC652_020303 [Populus alba x Populus x berolinensis]|nr:hypothetical protein NC652_020303 [Populus alba x Populus x berolinensis]